MGKIAILLPKFSRYGGVEGFGYNLAQTLADAGHAVTFICAKAETQAPVGVEVIPVGRKGIGRFSKLIWFLFQAEKQRKKGNYDLCVSLGKSLNQDVVRMGGGPLEPFWALSRQAYDPGFSRWWKMLRRRTAPVNLLIKYIENRQADSKTIFIANSHKVLNWLTETYPQIPSENLDIVYNKPDLGRFFPATQEKRNKLRKQAEISPEKIVIATAGTNFRLKGVETLVRSLAHLPEKHILRVAGGRNPARYLKLAKQLNVEKRVEFLGRVDDMAGFYQTADIFALPTFYDACSNAVLEALACGLPAISTACNGSSIFLDQEMVLADPKDFKTLAQLIQKAENQKNKLFEWPEQIQSGLEPYVDLVDRLLEK